MARKKNQQQSKKESAQNSGTQYHKEHASHVPDYGGNDIDPNAKG